MPRSVWADGRAMFTMVASSTTISWASAMKTSAFQRLASPVFSTAPGAFEAVADMGVPTSGLRDGKRCRNGDGSPTETAGEFRECRLSWSPELIGAGPAQILHGHGCTRQDGVGRGPQSVQE